MLKQSVTLENVVKNAMTTCAVPVEVGAKAHVAM